MRAGAVALLLLALTGCKTDSEKRREVFDCSTTGDTAGCLQMRYGWKEQDALMASLQMRVSGEYNP